MDEELDTVKLIYDHDMDHKKQHGYFPVHKNMAKVSGSLKWAQELRERLSTPMANFKHIEHP